MKKRILGIDLGTNSIGWAKIQLDFKNKIGQIDGLGSRIIPMSQDVLGKFDAGQSISQTAERTSYRGVRRLYQRDNLRRERLHRVLNVLSILPEHYSNAIDFEKKLGQFKPETEVKLPHKKNDDETFSFIFQEAFLEMVDIFKAQGYDENIPYDWTIYYLRHKALSQKIGEQELAWLILNFNQKRGYYQLRGEEEEISKDKNEEFFALKVEKVESTEDTNAKGTWYNVILENEWIYRRQSREPLFDWEGKTKEFIVTTSLENDGSIKKDKDGNDKRSFRAVDSEKDWIAIKKKTENDINASDQTVGTYIFEALLKDPKQKIRGKLVKTIERKYYKKELEKILDTQLSYHSNLFNENNLKKCVEELYPRNDGHQNTLLSQDFKHLFVNDIIFYQRPLKSKKSSIADCPYESRFYRKDGELIEQSLKVTSRSNPIFQEFRLWQFLHNLKIYVKETEIDGKIKLDVDVTKEFLSNDQDYTALFDKLNLVKEIDQKKLLSFFKLKETNHRWNYPEDKSYPCSVTKVQITNRLSKIDDLDATIFLDDGRLLQLWHLIYSVTDKKEYEKALNTYAIKNNLEVDQFVNLFKRFPPFESSYAAYSEKAIKKLLPLMRVGKYWNHAKINREAIDRVQNIADRLSTIGYDYEKIDSISDDDIPKRILRSFAKAKNLENPFKGLNTYQACYAVYARHSEVGEIVQWKQPDDIQDYLKKFKQHSLRNPIVEQVVMETLRVVRDIWIKYGEKEIVDGNELYKPLFDEIHVELGREMKNDQKTRQRLSKLNTDRENKNDRIKALLEEIKADPNVKDDVRPFSPSHQEILKIYEDDVLQNRIYRHYSRKQIEKGAFSKEHRSTTDLIDKAKPTRSEIQKYKLWLEQGYISPYTGKIIPLNKLFSTDYQIEHIIPQSRYFDNSMNNKIICESAVNEEKDNKTAYEFLKDKGGSVIDLGSGNSVQLFLFEEYESHCQTYFKNNRGKLDRLLSEDLPEGFINRQLNDSRYISKVVKGLLSNIVREDGELEATSKNLVPVTGIITSRLKHDWGLNDKWNEIIAPRFERLNAITESNDFGFWDEKINAFRIQVPKELERNFNKKRIDHRHHALDALVVACTTKDHINYITSLNTQRNNYKLVSKLRATKKIIDKNGRQRNVAQEYLKPWNNFTASAKVQLEKTVISFKKNNRVINKSNNKTWQWVTEDGKLKKKLISQTKGQNWAIRKPMHKETVSGKINMETPKGKIATATRVELSELKTRKRLESITDLSIQKILNNHIKNYLDDGGKESFELAFNQDGVDELNKNIQAYNHGKKHQPIKKVRLYEVGVKFSIGENGQKATKFVEAAKGTNLFFNIYWNENKQKRSFETVPLNEIIIHQKQVANLPKKDRREVPINNSEGQFIFSLSPNDLVFVPTEDEINNPQLVDLYQLSKDQIQRIYKMVSSSGNQCFFIKSEVANVIWNKNEYSALNKMERDINNCMIKDVCWKLNIDRIGNITKVIR